MREEQKLLRVLEKLKRKILLRKKILFLERGNLEDMESETTFSDFGMGIYSQTLL